MQSIPYLRIVILSIEPGAWCDWCGVPAALTVSYTLESATGDARPLCGPSPTAKHARARDPPTRVLRSVAEFARASCACLPEVQWVLCSDRRRQDDACRHPHGHRDACRPRQAHRSLSSSTGSLAALAAVSATRPGFAVTFQVRLCWP